MQIISDVNTQAFKNQRIENWQGSFLETSFERRSRVIRTTGSEPKLLKERWYRSAGFPEA